MKTKLLYDDFLGSINIWGAASHLTFLENYFLYFCHNSPMEIGEEEGGKLSRLKFSKSQYGLLINFPRELYCKKSMLLTAIVVTQGNVELNL